MPMLPRPHPALPAVLAAGLALPAAAGAVPFGADLSQPPNIAPTCALGAPTPPFDPPIPFPAQGSPSCTWTHNDAQTDQGLFVPVTGTVTAVRVRTGAGTGPMQAVVLRTFLQQTGRVGNPFISCCTVTAVSAPFTPAPNAVTTVPVDFPVVHEPIPPVTDTQTIIAQDQIGLTMLGPNVPIPLRNTGNNGGITPVSLIANTVFYPGLTAPSGAPVPETRVGAGGYLLMMQGEITPQGGAPVPAGPGAGNGGVLIPGLTVGGPARPIIRAGVFPLSLACGADAACAGRLLLATRPAAAAQAREAAARRVVLWSGRIALGPGARRTLRVRLNAPGRALLRSRRTLRAYVIAQWTGRAPVTVRALTLRRG